MPPANKQSGGGAKQQQKKPAGKQREEEAEPKKGEQAKAVPKGFSPKQQLERLTKKGDVMQKLNDELAYVQDACSKFDRFLDPANATRNRYANLILYDHSRVVLNDAWTKNHGDYIHASLVDGYDRPGQYILAQAPFNDMTEFDFWRTIWSENPSVIVLLSPLGGDMKKNGIGAFWSLTKAEKTYCDGALRAGVDCDLYDLALSKAGEAEAFFVTLLHVHCWTQDDDVPNSLLNLQARARMAAHLVEKQPDRDKSPMCLVCASGVHRSGTFAALDITVKRMQDSRRVALKETVDQLRYERYGICQLLNHYLYLVEAIVSVAMQAAYVHPDDVGADVIMFTLRNAKDEEKPAEEAPKTKMPSANKVTTPQ